MSGFITIYNINGEPVDEHLIHSLTQTLKFRGPDQQKIWVHENIGMGHALFQTTNEAKYENQPSTLDQHVWITCTARIDDRENLIKKLGISAQINLNKTPDSDLILHAYKKWGEECLDYLLGDFAFVIWDSRYKKIFCARDRFGVRQLYYAQKQNSFIVCNSLSCMLQHPNITKQLNDRAIGGFLLLGDHTWIDKSITAFKDVASLLPAHKLIFQQGKLNIQKYWDIPNDLPMINYKKTSDYIEHFQEILKVSVSDRIRTPSIAIAMSGGMDSTAIAATIHQLQQDSTHPAINVHAVTGLHERLLQCNERYYADMVAKKLNMPIHFISGDDYPLLQSDITTTRPMEMLTPTYWLDFKKLILSYSRVELTGASTDNLFAFSPAIATLKEVNPLQVLFSIYQLRKKYGKTPSIGSGIKGKLNQMIGRHKKTSILPYPYPSWLNPEFEKSQKLKEIWSDFFSSSKLQSHFRHPSAYDQLTKPDWNTDDIAFKTNITLPEERDPYLDLRLIEFVFSLPATPWFFNKHLLRLSMENILPNEVINRPKTPLGDLQSKLLLQPENNWIDHWHATPGLSDYIKLENIPSLLSENNIQDKDASYVNLRPLLLNIWLSQILK